jgi:hypothetical protein
VTRYRRTSGLEKLTLFVARVPRSVAGGVIGSVSKS